MKEPDIWSGLARDLLHYPRSLRPLNLVPKHLSPALIDSGPFVPLCGCVVLASLEVVLHPVRSRRTADKIESVVIEVKENSVADNVSVAIACYELLCLIDLEILEGVHTQVGKQPERIGTLYI